MIGDTGNQYDRITQILQSQAAPQVQPLGPIESANAFLSSLNGGNFSDIAAKQQQQSYDNARQTQQDTVNNQINILKVFEAKKAAGDAQAQALDEKIKLFTGDDPEGMSIFLQGLHDDPENIDPGNSYQVMTKLAKIAKQTGYKSRELRQKEGMDSVNDMLIKKLNGSPNARPLNVRNNNPGNMKKDGQFRTFDSPQEGVKSMKADLMAKISGKSKAMEANFGKGYQPTLSNVITTWAPPTENDTANYVNFVAQKTGIDPNQVLSPMDIQKIIPAMIEMEGGKDAVQYYQPVQTADSGQTANDATVMDGMDEITQMQVMAALASGDTAGALKTMADARKSAEPSTDIGKMQRDEQMGLVPKGSTEDLIKQKSRQTRKEEADLKISERASQKADEQSKVTQDVADTKVQEAMDLLNNGGMNVGGLSATGSLWLPGKSTDADRLESVYSTLKSVMSLDKLMEMKKASQTGSSGLGALSNNELKMLTDSVTALDPELPIETQKQNLATIQRILGFGKNANTNADDPSTMSDDEILRKIHGG